MKLISVVICTHARAQLALRAVRSVIECGDGDFEVIVVDQEPAGALGELLRHEWGDEPRLRYVHTDTVGLSHARNLGVARSRAAACVFLDDDARALPGWLASYREAFSADPPPDMVGGRTVPEWQQRRPPWYPTRRLPLLGLYDVGQITVEFPKDDLPVGANFGVLRQSLLAAGGFDESLGYRVGRRLTLAGEDSLVAHRVLRNGGRILYHPGALAVHLVRPEKLRLRGFARRCFTEGRTQIALLGRTAASRRVYLLGVARWHAQALARAPLQLLRQLLEGRLPGLEPVGDLVAVACFAAGVVFESWLGSGRTPAARPVET